MIRVPAGGVAVAERHHVDRRLPAATLKRHHVGLVCQPRRHVALEDGVRERHPVAGHEAVAGERGDRADHVPPARQAGAEEHRRGRRPNAAAAAAGGVGADTATAEHTHGAPHGALQRRGAGHELAGDLRRRRAPLERVPHVLGLGGARGDAERGEDGG